MNFVYLRKIVTPFLFLFSVIAASAQPGCPSVSAGNDVSLPCGTNCTNLTATFFQTGATTDYSVSSIPYSPPFPFTGGTQLFINQDDIWGSVINLPFTFCFYGNSYTQAVIGANGVITFDATQAGQYCEWSYSATIPTPGPPPTGIYNNSINGAYHDIDPSVLDFTCFCNPANINYAVLGSAPCRTFVVNFSTVPHYDCNNLQTTQQIVMYETTNVIEVYIKDKPTCSTWNSGNAVIGLQNATGSMGITPPGRNTGPWSANNEAWRFTPNGTSIVTIDWFQGATHLTTGTTVNVCPGSNTTYTAQATYLPCAGGTPVVVTDNVNVNLAGALQAGIDSSHNVSCFGANDGKAWAHASTSNSGLQYGWADGNNSLTRTGLSPGTYIFTATDASACVRADTVIITQPTQVTANVPNVTQTNCSGTGTGTLVAGRNGGTAPYTFLWSSLPAQTDSVLDNVAAATYTVTVTDSKGCTAVASGTLTINVGGNSVTLNAPVITNVSCFGGTDGSITASATGGSGTYTYNWSNLQTGATILNVDTGQYCVLANDGAGCTVSACYNVAQPTQVVINTPNITNIGCGGAATGSITANVSGGTPIYTYNWAEQSNSQTYTGQTINGLSVDNYNVTVSDAHNCSVTASYAVTSVPSMVFTQSQTNVSCFGGSDGSATITITTGTPPYNYAWNGAAPVSNATLNGIAAGPVNVIFTDANCSATATFTIMEPTQVVVNQVSQTDVTCYGGTNGTVTVNASGGTPGAGANQYSYTWNSNPAQTGPAASGLPGGPVTVIAADGNGCTVSQTYTLIEPSQLTASTQPTNATCNQAPNGSILASASGGTQPYGYQWSDPDNQTGKMAVGLLAGSYSCIVTDANGCNASAADVVNEPADMVINTTETAVKCIGDQNGTISVTATGGTSPYTYSATLDFANFVSATNGVIEGLGIGVYSVLVSDSNGCTKTVLATVPNAVIDNFTTSTDSTSCYGASYNDGGAHIAASVIQNGPFEFSLDGSIPQPSGDFFNISAGPHTITASNGNGCVSAIPVVVLEPLPIIVDVTPDTVKLPLGEGQQVMVTYLNANGEVTYNWTPALGLSCIDCPNPLVSPFMQQDYVVTVSMVNGSSTCYGSATLHADVLDPFPIFVPNSFSPNGDGNNDVFKIYGQGIKTVDLKIFNRWGELVYLSNNQFDGWDGTYKGQMQLPSVFTYSVRVTYLDDKKADKKGTVTLLR